MDRELTKGLARRVVVRLAPGEEEIFDSLADYSLDDPERARGSSAGDAPLGAGLALAVEYLIPAVMFVCGRVTELLTDKALEKSGTGILKAITRARRGNRGASDPASSTETPSNREDQLRAAALAAGVAYGLPDDVAARVADEVIVQLVADGLAG